MIISWFICVTFNYYISTELFQLTLATAAECWTSCCYGYSASCSATVQHVAIVAVLVNFFKVVITRGVSRKI